MYVQINVNYISYVIIANLTKKKIFFFYFIEINSSDILRNFLIASSLDFNVFRKLITNGSKQGRSYSDLAS